MSREQYRDDLQPDELARLGRVASRSSGMKRRLGGHVRSIARRGLLGRGTTVFSQYTSPQRVTVKIHLVRHQSSYHGKESLARHIRYLQREGVGLEGIQAEFYSRDKEGLDAKGLSKEWADDRHHFRVILSPELGGDIPGLQEYTRRVMRRVEKDLDTPLEWVAINHYNTDQPHVHVLIRGKTKEQDLVIQKPYIKHGFRGRAQEVATQLIGERTKSHARQALRKQVHAERWTELDFIIRRLANQQDRGGGIDLSQVKLRPTATFNVEMIDERLRFLKGLGLASNENAGEAQRRFPHGINKRFWTFKEDYEQVLRDLGDRNDVIKQIHQALGRDAAKVTPHIERLKDGMQITGTVITKGLVDELSDNRFVVVEDHGSVSKRAVQAQVFISSEYDALDTGSVVTLKATDYRNANLFLHTRFDVQQQMTAEAWTWLDKQIYRYQQADEEQKKAFRANKIYPALQQRAAWMFANGYAMSSTPRVTLDSFQLKAGVSKKLKGKELATLSKHSQNPERQWVLRIEPNEKVVGKLLAVEHLHQGTIAVLQTRRGLVAAPLLSAPRNMPIGTAVQVSMAADRRVTVKSLGGLLAKTAHQKGTAPSLGGGR